MNSLTDRFASAKNYQSDADFLSYLNEFITQELSLLEQNDFAYTNKERFSIFKQAFSKMIAFVQVYKNLMTNIKKEYEFCIEELEKRITRKRHEIDQYFKHEEHALTIRNLELRKDELNEKLNQIYDKNVKLSEDLKAIREKNEEFRPKPFNKYRFIIEREISRSNQTHDETKKMIPGVSVDKATDLEYLNQLLENIDQKIKDLAHNQSKKYSNKSQKVELEANLHSKISAKESRKNETETLKNRIHILKTALNAAKDYYSTQKDSISIQDAISKAIINNYLIRRNKTDEEFFEDEFGLEDDSQYILDYIERFNDLFEDGKYAEAAYFAAASPKNILRNIQTTFRFKEISLKTQFAENNDPLLIYCNALIDSIGENSPKPNEEMSIECANVALRFSKLDLLTRWIAQKKLTVSYHIAKNIHNYARQNPKYSKNSYELALFVYREIEADFETAICLSKLGRFDTLLDLIASKKDLLSKSDVLCKILKECPSIKLACLMQDNLDADLSTAKIVGLFLDSDQPENGLKFLKHQIEKHSAENQSGEEIDKLKESYETLIKFSFLAQDNDQLAKEAELNESNNQKLHDLYCSAKKSNLNGQNQQTSANNLSDMSHTV